MKIVSFVWGAISFVLSVLMSGLCYNVYSSIKENSSGAAAISLIATIPLLIILYIALIGFLLSAVVSSVKAIFSDSKAIKALSIILVVLEVCVTVFNVFVALNFLG